MRSSAGMGNEVSAGEAEENEEEGGWTSREETQASGGLWLLSHQLDDGKEVCVFTCTATSAAQAQLCQSGAEHLRLLRHPGILKFLTYDIATGPVIMVTEPVLPVRSVMSGVCVEGMVTGWRGVVQGLSFLHDKAKLSHNSLCCECVYVCVNTSHWKIGGFEAAAYHSNITHTFIETIASIRPPSTVPPEDKSPSPESSSAVPCHSRDVWALGHLMLSTIEEANLNSQISDAAYSYIQRHMLNPDPTLRPTAVEVLRQQWMKNDASEIAEFLSCLTVKSQAERDEFFTSLSPRLHALPPCVVAEHLVPLLLTPLVMTERIARRSLWPHLLTPVSATHPKRMIFDPSHICPLLDEELFVYHLVPLLFNLMEKHDYHVRMVLLEHLRQFTPLCPRDELVSSLLPEVLVGLHDCHDEMVQATLCALADLVETLGCETVMGTPRSNIFADATPRSQCTGGLEKTIVSPVTPTSLPIPPSPSSPSTSQQEARRQRAEKMRVKREMQKKKKMAGSSKLGVVEGVESEELTTPPGHAQYSPSVSHDEEDRVNPEIGEEPPEEEEREEEEEEGEGDEEGEGEEEGEGDEGEGEVWEEFSEDRGGDSEWRGGWGGEEEEERGGLFGGVEKMEDMVQSPRSSRSSGSLRLGTSSGKRKEERREVKRTAEKDSGSWSRARFNEEDRLRLEEQASWTREPDFFADMTPAVAKTTPSLGLGAKTTPTSSSALQYQPTKTEEGDGWGSWNDF